MVVLRTTDPSMPDGYRFICFNSIEEAIAQAANDQARDGRTLGATFWEGDRSDNHQLVLHTEIKGREEELSEATEAEIEHLRGDEA